MERVGALFNTSVVASIACVKLFGPPLSMSTLLCSKNKPRQTSTITINMHKQTRTRVLEVHLPTILKSLACASASPPVQHMSGFHNAEITHHLRVFWLIVH
jgi:hypothetical protein